MVTINVKHSLVVAFPLIAALAFSIYIVQHQIAGYKGIEKKIEEFVTLPKGEYLKPAVFGYDQLVADIIWLRAIQVIGDKVVTPKGYEWVYHAMDVVTTLDPKFAYAYQFGGVTLSELGNRPDMSNMLLEKGLKENPEVWQIPFYLGFNNFFHLHNYEKAAKYMSIASELPGHPEYLPKLASRLYVQAGNPDIALEFLINMYKETDDEKVKESLEKRIKEVIIERDAIYLERGVAKYKEVYKDSPENLQDLVRMGIIKDIPPEPFGGYYYFDQSTNKVYSSVIRERMQVYGK
ncbi:MAG TPA: hypothetical protein DDX84_12135 [Nitrospiraceae bacterium]|nr:hypothetical protein [Nitrospiraceae bacterium]